MMQHAPGISPLLEPVSCEVSDVSIPSCGVGFGTSSRSKRASDSAGDVSAPENVRTSSDRMCQKPSLGIRSSLRSSTSTAHVRFSDNPVAFMDEEPTANYPAQHSPLPEAGDDHSWAAGSKHLSIDAGRTPHRSSNPLVSFASGDARGAVSDADAQAMEDLVASDNVFGSERSMSACTEDVPVQHRMRRSVNAGQTPMHSDVACVHFADTPARDDCGVDESIGAEEWAQVVSAASTPMAHCPAPSPDFGDVDGTPESSVEGSGADVDDAPLWIVADDEEDVPRCSREERARLSMNAGHTPAPSRTASGTGELQDDCTHDADAGGQTTSGPLAPVAAAGRGLLAPKVEMEEAAARLDFNTHGAMRVGGRGGGPVQRVSFAANTADPAAANGDHPSAGPVITPHVRSCRSCVALYVCVSTSGSSVHIVGLMVLWCVGAAEARSVWPPGHPQHAFHAECGSVYRETGFYASTTRRLAVCDTCRGEFT